MVKILSTTDGKYIGEKADLPSVYEAGAIFEYKNVRFEVDSVKIEDHTVTLHCPNYMVVLETE